MLLQWCNQTWQSLEEGAGKRCSECELHDEQTSAIVGNANMPVKPENFVRNVAVKF